MTSPTSLLQALHSCLIDELCERHPDPKPELGLPQRKTGWEIPAPELQLWVSSFDIKESDGTPRKGVIVFGFSEGFLTDIGTSSTPMTALQLWKNIGIRLGAELSRRQLQPAFTPLEPQTTSPGLSRVIWLPIRLRSSSLWFGMGFQ